MWRVAAYAALCAAEAQKYIYEREGTPRQEVWSVRGRGLEVIDKRSLNYNIEYFLFLPLIEICAIVRRAE